MIKMHYDKVKETIQDKASLCIVTKKRSIEEIRSYYDAGERIFGENHVQELIPKAQALPQDISWQFIGHLQRNKVKQVLPYISCLQSLDSIALAEELEKECKALQKTLDVLIELHLAAEDEAKTGVSLGDYPALLEYVKSTDHLRLCGLMAMGPHTDDTERIAAVFRQAKELFDQEKAMKSEAFQILSMGMSADYPVAVACGSTMVRVGTYLFTEDEK